MSDKDTKDLIGKIFDSRYQITGLIGHGGMGVVYKAVHIAMNQVVALKVLSRAMTGDDTQVQRFYQEARASSRLKHPNTIRVFDFGRAEEGHLYIAMEFLDGETLTSVLKREGALPARRALNIAKQVAKSLAEAHAQGLVHRDLKPDNVFLTQVYGEEDFVKVLDFGIAKFLESSPDHERLTIVGGVIGTPTYVSPEQGLGRTLDGRTDLYSLGVILYEMLCGSPPFKAETPIATIMRHIHDEPPPLTQFKPDLKIPPSVRDLVFWLLEKDRTKRPDSAEIVVQTVDRILPEVPVVEVKSSEFAKDADKAGCEPGKEEEEGIILEDLTEIIPGFTPDAPTKVVSKKEETNAPEKIEVMKAEIRVKPASKKNMGRWKTALVVVAVVLASGFLGIVMGLQMSEAGQEVAIGDTRESHPVELPNMLNPVPRPQLVLFWVNTEPEGATIEVVGGGVAKAPVFMALSGDGEPVRLKIGADGYKGREVLLGAQGVQASGEREFLFTLEKLAQEPERVEVRKAQENSAMKSEKKVVNPESKATPRPRTEPQEKKRKRETLDWE
jgi:serine/threonine protein kinase